MKRTFTAAVAAVLTLTAAGAAFAQPGGYVRHDEWKKGYHMKPEDWHRGQPVDYRHYHLSAPPRGYEWRSVDGNYVLAAVATGVIASAVVASTVH